MCARFYLSAVPSVAAPDGNTQGAKAAPFWWIQWGPKTSGKDKQSMITFSSTAVEILSKRALGSLVTVKYEAKAKGPVLKAVLNELNPADESQDHGDAWEQA